jgi:hypothetical protein
LWALAHPHNQAYLGKFTSVMLMLVGATALIAQMIGALQSPSAPVDSRLQVRVDHAEGPR